MSGFSPEFKVKGDRSTDDPFQTFLANVAAVTSKTKGQLVSLFKSNTKEQNNLIGVVYAATHGIIEAEDEDKDALYDSLAQFLATPQGQAVMQNIQRIFDLRQEAMGRDVPRRGHIGGPAAAQMDVDEEIAAQARVNIPTAVVFLYEISTGESSTMDHYENKEDAVEELTRGVAAFTPIANVRPAGYVNPSARSEAARVPGVYTNEERQIRKEALGKDYSDKVRPALTNTQRKAREKALGYDADVDFNADSDDVNTDSDDDNMDVAGGKRKSRKYRKTGKKSKKGYKKYRKSAKKSRKGRKKRYSRHHKK
jgi:hypothetical protein